MSTTAPAPASRRLRQGLRRCVLLGAWLVLLVPAVRGHHPLLGWLPLWLLGMPAAAWWASAGFPLRSTRTPMAGTQRRRRPRGRPQARRLNGRAPAAGIARAA